MAHDPARLIVLVTGAHLRAETGDRPIAYRLRTRMLDWLAARGLVDSTPGEHPGADGAHHPVVVCSDLWYLNRPELRERPTVSIGGPGVNALSAHLADKLPSAYALDGVLLVQMDLELIERVACCWGTDHAATVAAVDAFIQKYLDDFMSAAIEDWAA